ncbi:hypothetical protein BKA56DRAFT_601247 [Ilyonectria sp. MPI-CAGE-AT-0026]|nr:hypothetical protein BKA56DRAFT_601247 [Ilyonectria sp. MPI-CAGE-AT-0026]
MMAFKKYLYATIWGLSLSNESHSHHPVLIVAPAATAGIAKDPHTRWKGDQLESKRWFYCGQAGKDHKIATASICSTLGGSLSLWVQDGRTLSVDGKKYTEPI